MAQVPSGQKFHTVPPNVETKELGSKLANSQREIYTMQDIIDTAGVPGPQGVQGPVGPAGPIGPVGPAGLNWQGAWVSGTSYVADDAVGYNGASYFCILATSGTIAPDLDTTHWALLASQGAQGPAGPAGAQGPTGATGPAGTSNPKVIDLKVTNGAVVTGTINASISQTLLIPANTFTSDGGMLEFMGKFQKTGFAGTQSCSVFLNTAPNFTGGAIIALFAAGPGGGGGSNLTVQGIRTARIQSNTLTIFPATTTGITDYVGTQLAQTSVAFDPTVDNYLLFAITLTNAADSSVVEMARAVKYE